MGGDILICAGDVSSRGSLPEIKQFLDWFADQDYSYLILIPGNHDFGFEKSWDYLKQYCEDKGIIVLNDSGCEVEGIKIWGSPIQPWFHDWAFNRWRGAPIKKHWDLIPEDTEILITHGPPYGILDRTRHGDIVGCKDLLEKIKKTKIKLHVFGHIHEGAGYQYKDGITYVNASVLDEYYGDHGKGIIRVIKDLAGEYLVEKES